MIKKEDVYCIGKIGKTHGVRGELTFLFYDDVFERTGSSCLILEVDGILVPFFFEECRFKNDTTAIVKFCDVDTQSKAQQLTSCEVFFPRKHNDDTIKQLSWAQIISFTLVDVACLLYTSDAADDSTEV